MLILHEPTFALRAEKGGRDVLVPTSSDDVVTGPSGRRRWPEQVKAEIVLESYRDGVSVADVARKHGVSAPQLVAVERSEI